MLRSLLSLFFIGFISVWGGASWAASTDFTQPYQGLLSAHLVKGEADGIRSTLVDYGSWAKDPRHAQAMQALQSSQPETLKADSATAFWVNAYHLLVIDVIIQNKEAQSVRNMGDILGGGLDKATWTIGGKSVTLPFIRKEMLNMRADVRLYLALCDGTLSAPDLRAEAYRAETLSAQLNAQAQEFIRNPTKGVNELRNILEVSTLFKQHASDFEAYPGGLVGFLRVHHSQLPHNAIVQGYLPYDWELNGSW